VVHEENRGAAKECRGGNEREPAKSPVRKCCR